MDNDTQTIKAGVQLASEYLIPGGSNLIKGDFVTGGIHALAGLAAAAAFGLPGLLIVKANSFATAITGHNLIETFRPAPQPPAPPAQPEPSKSK
jgi:hypothetical protein